jgi:exonuclease III
MQEMQIVDEKLIFLYWKMNYVSSCVSTNREGVITLFDNSLECVESYNDNEGRVAIVGMENEKNKAVVVNVHYPNDHKAAYEFMEKVNDKVFELLDKYLSSFVTMGGDFNVCMSENDSLNRVKTKQKSYLTDYTMANNSTCEMMYVCRCMEADGG